MNSSSFCFASASVPLSIFLASLALVRECSSQDPLDVISATLVYNKLTPERGYEAFDFDKDGKVSRSDLHSIAKRLDLAVSKADLDSLFDFIEAIDGGAKSFLSREAWQQALAQAKAFQVQICVN